MKNNTINTAYLLDQVIKNKIRLKKFVYAASSTCYGINNSKTNIELNKNLIIKYFPDLNDLNSNKYKLFNDYFINFYHFCFEISPETMIKDALKFKV